MERITITAAEFLEKIQQEMISNNRNITISNFDIQEFVHLKLMSPSLNLHLENVHFFSDIIINNSEINSINFVKCKIKHIEIIDSKFYFFSFFYSQVYKFTILESVITDSLSFHNIEISINSFWKIEKVKVNVLDFYNIKVNWDVDLNIKITNADVFENPYNEECSINHICFDKCSNIYLIIYNKITINNNLAIHNSQFSEINIESCIIKAKYDIKNSEIDTFTFSKNEFHNTFNFEKTTFKIIKLQYSKFFEKTDLTFSKAKSILIEDCEFKNLTKLKIVENNFKISKLRIHNNNFNHSMIVEKLIINKLDLSCSALQIGTINFQENEIKELLIYNDNSKGSFIFQKCSIELLKFENLFNYGNVLFSSCKPLSKDSTIEFINSNLGKMQFFDFSFKSFKEIKIENTYLSEIVPTNVEWFEDHQLAEIELKQKRELYRQLKLATEKQSDRVSALHFQAEEMTVHKKIISIQKNSFWESKNGDFWKKLNDNFSLWTGKTNDFGQNWIKPFGLSVISTLVFYVFVIIAYSKNLQFWDIALCQHEWNHFFSELYKHSKILAQMFNPTFSSKAILEDTSAWAYVLLEIHRIFLGFFIFQTINAFRKFFKAG